MLKGAEGEDLALGIPTALPGSLATLADDYIVFNQIRVPWRSSVLELDHVVIGPNGVFNVECKHMVGEIDGSHTDKQWIQRKCGAGGVWTTREFRNPILQVKRSSHALATYLRARGIDVWVEPIMVFTHPAGRLRASSNSTPLLKLEQLAPCIQMSGTRRPFRQQTATTRAIKLLRNGDWRSNDVGTARGTAGAAPSDRPGGPRHISNFMRDLVPERVEAFMHQNLSRARKEARQEEKQSARTSARGSTIPMVRLRTPTPGRDEFKRRPRFTVIRGGASRTTSRRRTIVRTIMKSVETVQTEESDENEISF